MDNVPICFFWQMSKYQIGHRFACYCCSFFGHQFLTSNSNPKPSPQNSDFTKNLQLRRPHPYLDFQLFSCQIWHGVVLRCWTSDVCPPSSFPLWGKMRMVVFHQHLHLPWCPTCQQGSQKSRKMSITVNNGWNVFSKWGVDFVWSIRCLKNDGLISTIVFKGDFECSPTWNEMKNMIEIFYFKRCEMWNYQQVYHEVPKELLVISKHVSSASGVAVTFAWCEPRTCPWACQICQSPEGRCPVPVEAPSGWLGLGFPCRSPHGLGPL